MTSCPLICTSHLLNRTVVLEAKSFGSLVFRQGELSLCGRLSRALTSEGDSQLWLTLSDLITQLWLSAPASEPA